MIEALIAGETDPLRLASLASSRIKASPTVLGEVACRLLWFEGTLGYSPKKGDPPHVMLTSTGASAAN